MSIPFLNICVSKRHLMLCVCALTFLSPLGQSVAVGQAPGMLPKYQARAPRTCSSVTKAPSAAEASVMVQCAMEGLAPTGLTLIQDLHIQMGTPRPFVYRTDAGLAGIDLNATVYPLRGSYTTYFCRTIGNGVPAGHSCIKTATPESEGWCWKTSFGDYKCRMHGGASPDSELGMPAPTTY
jgi:hypothetical protein